MTIKKILLAVVSSLLILSLLAGFGAYWGILKINDYAQSPLTLSAPQELQVTSGTTIRAIMRTLATQGLIDNDWRFKGLLKLHPELANIQAGLYEIKPNESLSSLLQKLNAGDEKSFSVTLIEGKTIGQWQQELKNQPHLVFSKDSFAKVLAEQNGRGNPEGQFFPDTFHYTAGQSSHDLLTLSYQKMQQELKSAWEGREKGLPLKSPYELLILASIVEKETGLKSERDWVAAVFINRLRKGMRLQTDPTVIYGMGESYNGNITRKDLRTKTPYNTYRINGLPPTPIAAPSKAALMAAAHPAKVSYLYFVSRNDGSHVFSNTLKAHNRAVNKFQRNRSATK